MKTIVIYSSKTGFTKKYANWIAQAAQAEVLDVTEAKKKNSAFFEAYDAIVYGGWAIAGKIHKLNWFENNILNLEGKKLIVYCVGASPADSTDIPVMFAQIFKDQKWDKVERHYCPGGLDYDKMSTPTKLTMKMFVKMLKSKKDKTEQDEIAVEMLSKSFDISNEKYIQPILNSLK